MEDKLPYLVLARGMIKAVEEDIELTAQQRRILLNRISEILRPVCKATDEAFVAGFDAGAEYGMSARKHPGAIFVDNHRVQFHL